jgi:hypothetical protein
LAIADCQFAAYLWALQQMAIYDDIAILFNLAIANWQSAMLESLDPPAAIRVAAYLQAGRRCEA